MAKSEQVRVVFIRSGRTEWDEAGRLAGSTDLPLNNGGRAEVAAAAEALRGTRLASIVCGPDEASRESARMVAQALSAEPRIRAVDDLSEICLGLWEGKLATQLESTTPKAYRQWREDPGTLVIPEGETFEEAQARIVKALAKAFEKSNGDGATGVVLRPIALGLTRCWLDGADIKSVWSMMDDAIGPFWRTIRRDLFRQDQRRTRATA